MRSSLLRTRPWQRVAAAGCNTYRAPAASFAACGVGPSRSSRSTEGGQGRSGQDGRGTAFSVLGVSTAAATALYVAAGSKEEQAKTKENVETAVGILQQIFGVEKACTDKALCGEYVDDKYMHHKGVMPSCVVYPESTEDVATVMKVCSRFGCPVVPYCCGTSSEGNIVPTTSGIILNLRKMNRIKVVHERDGDVVVEAGVQWMELNDDLLKKGSPLFFPIDGKPGASVGGMCGVNASGASAVRYGQMRDWVLGLTVVLPNGKIVKTGCRARKNSAGYSLNDLFVGSEGTLGIVTQATLRLAPRPAKDLAVIAPFVNVAAAAQAASLIVAAGVPVSSCELLDENMVNILNSESILYKKLLVKPTLMITFSGSEDQIQNAHACADKIVKKHQQGLTTTERSCVVEDGDRAGRVAAACMGTAFNTISYMQRKYPKADIGLWSTEICIPVGQMPALITDTLKDIKDDSGLEVAITAHAGDGTITVLVPIDKSNKAMIAKAQTCFERLYDRATSVNGTCAGENGIGVAKMDAVIAQTDPAAYVLMQDVKKALDPLNILNRGKVVDLNYSLN